MQPKVFVIWLVATVVAVVAAVGVLVAQPEIATFQVADELAFPQLGPKFGQVTTITVTTGEGEIRLTRNEDGSWIAPDTHDYPAAEDKIHDLLLAVANLRLLEAKTRRPERFSRLEVEDVDAEDAKSKLIRLETADGEVVAEGLIGKLRYGLAGDKDVGTYVRRAGEEQAWLATGSVEVETVPRNWLHTIVVDISRPDVKRVEMRPAEGQPYAANKETREDKYFKLEGLLEDQETKAESSGIGLARLLTEVRLEEVKPRDEVPFPPEATHVTDLTTFDGVKVTAELAEIEEEKWVNFAAAFIGEADDESDAAKAARELVADINRRTDRWSIRVPGYIFSRLTAPVTDLLKSDEPAELPQVPAFNLPQVPGQPPPPILQLPPPAAQQPPP